MVRILLCCVFTLVLSSGFIYAQDSAIWDIVRELRTQEDLPFEDTATGDDKEGTASDNADNNLADPLNISPGDAATDDIEKDLTELAAFDTDTEENVVKSYRPDSTDELKDDTDPCYEHDVLSCIDQSMRFDNRSVIKCDNQSRWFRFMGDAGSQMATSCVPVHHCGTEAPGWLNGQHPASPGQEGSARVCYHWENDCCKFEAQVVIRNCDGFFVYKLLKLPDKCALRVCSNGALIPTNIPTTSKPSTTQEPTTTTEQLTVTSKPSTTQEPATTTEQLTVTSKPSTTQEPATTTEQLTVTSKPSTTQEPTTISAPSTTKATTTDQPTATRTPRVTQAVSTTVEGSTEAPTPSAVPVRPECRMYNALNESDRSVLYTAGWSRSKCDKYIIPGWYRFLGAAGNKMPERAPPKLHCGAHAPGWLKGRHPTVDEGSVTRTVCYHWQKNTCQWSNQIKVTNCGEFYVYHLVGPPVCRLRYCVAGVAPTQCLFYKPINEGDRSIKYKSNRRNVKCDSKLVSSWYRFVGLAGNQMPESAPPMKRCGTHAPGWLNGKHPSVAQSTVKQRVCYHWKNDDCRWSNDILVTNCGDFFVYNLGPTPACNLRYCGVRLALPPKPECRNYAELKGKDRSVDFTATKFNAKCDKFLVTKWYRFSGEAGNQMPNKPPPMKRCGTLAPGWLMGNHPSEEEGRVTRKVCYTWKNKICRWSNNIQVTNCGDYFVYELSKPPTCRLRYCGISKVPATEFPVSTTALPDKLECFSYSVLDEKDRLVEFTAAKFKPKCDKLLATKWYRFTGAAGNQMANSPPPIKSCTTHAPGWLRGAHPSVADGRVTRKVCFNWKADKCFWSTNIQVTNCGLYFVYKLSKPPACRLRYCGINWPINPTTPGMTTPTASVATSVPDVACSNVMVLDEFDRSENYNYRKVKGGRPKCDRSLAPGWYRFGGRAGTRMSDKCVPNYRCATDAPGWLKGGHPSVQEGVVDREVCFNFRDDCCMWSSQIEVRNCGAFYVYRLDGTPSCFFRYCGNGKSG